MTSENESNITINEEENVIQSEEEELAAPMDTKTEEEEETAVASSEEQPMNTENETDVPSNVETENEVNVPPITETENEVNAPPITETENKVHAHPVLDQSVIIEGKRSRKPTLRLEITEPVSTKKELSIPQGHGKPLGEIEYINYQITHASSDALSRMRNICFGRRGNKATIRKNLRAFKGFEFDLNSDEYKKHFNNLIKFKKDELRSISNILGLPATGRNTEHAERILNFLIKPVDEGKKIPGRKSVIRNLKKRSTNSKESVDTDHETANEVNSSQGEADEKGSNYNFKPGKRSSDEENTSNIKKRKKTVSKSKENDHSSSNTVEDVN